MDVAVPELRDAPVTLVPAARVTRGFRGRESSPDQLRDALSLGVPVVQAVSAELAGEDKALLAFLAQEASAWRFHLVHLGCTFMPGDGDRFDQAWLSVQLARSDGDSPPPIAWSLAPDRASRPVTNPRTITLGAKLLIEASVEVQTSGSHTETFVTTYGLQEPNCSWEFTRTSLDELRGTQRLALITRSPKDVSVTGTISLRATFTRPRFSKITYRLLEADAEALSFAL
jgi:hypothetical protein